MGERPSGKDQKGAMRQGLKRLATFADRAISGSPESASLAEKIGNFVTTRRGFNKLAAGAVIGTEAAATVVGYFITHPERFQDAKIALKFSSVWDELNELKTPLTNEDLLGMVHNPFKKIVLTSEQATSVLIIGNADSEYLRDGKRQNHFGFLQPDNWLAFAKDKISAGLQALAVSGNIQYANYEQPGASSQGIIGQEKYAGNVQLGARTLDDMATDKPGEIPPRQMMENFQGTVLAAIGLHGDDMRDTADLVVSLMDEQSNTYNPDFASFIKEPTKEKLEKSDRLVDLIVTVLQSYKKDKERIKVNFAKALDIYAQINDYRKRNGKGDMYLIATQPIRLDQATNAPYIPLTAAQGATGSINLKDYGDGGKLAGFLVTVPFYKIEAPLLETFEQSTGIQVSSIPFLNLSGDETLSAADGHFNLKAHGRISDIFDQLVSVTHNNMVLEFEADGKVTLTTP